MPTSAPSLVSLEADLEAAHAALGVALRLRGSTMIIWDLISAMTSLWEASIARASLAARGIALDEGARRLTILAVNFVGPRRTHELVDACDQRGAGRHVQ